MTRAVRSPRDATLAWTAEGLAAEVRNGRLTPAAAVDAALQRIAARLRAAGAVVVGTTRSRSSVFEAD